MGLTDVFIRVYSCNEMRLGFAIATVARWKMQKDCRVSVFTWSDCPEHLRYDFADVYMQSVKNENYLHYKPFATHTLEFAEEQAQSDPYIICNDDNLPYGQDFVSKGLDLMDRHPEYGIISGVVVNGEPYGRVNDVHEIHAVGGLVFLRKGLVTEFPALEDAFWDGERHRQITEKGFKSGYSHKLPYLHMGAGFSVANPSHFNGA